MNKLALALSTWFGCGYSPIAPGTAGSLGALVVAWPLIQLGLNQPWHYLALAVLLTPAAIWSASATARIVAKKDPGLVVVDEVLGQWITLAGASTLDLPHFVAAFFLFRAFDIIKPWPVRRLEQLPEGTGIVADDLAAGVLGAVVLLVAGWFNF